MEIWRKNFEESQSLLGTLLADPQFLKQCQAFSERLIACYRAGGKILTCGNGGSHCDAMHFAEEMTGRYRKDRRPLGALALGDASHTTCVANDYGFQYIFSRQVEALGRSGDVLVGLSTSGNSANVIEAVKKAKELGIHTVGLLGRNGGELRNLVDIALVVPAQTSDRIQEVHIKLIHNVIELIERDLFPSHYA